MGVKDYAKKQILKKVENKVFVGAVSSAAVHVDKWNTANSLAEKEQKDKLDVESAVSTRSFFEKSSTYKLTMVEKVVSLRKNFVVSDNEGNTLYTVKSEGLPKMPELGIYDKKGNKIGKTTKGLLGNPVFTLYCDGKQIASLYQRVSLKPKYEIPENGWSVEVGLTKTTVFDGDGVVAVKIQHMLSAKKNTLIVEYTNKDNEVPAILLACTMVIAYYMN